MSANIIRANDYMARDGKLYFHVPRIKHQVASLLYINGEVWICDSGLNDGGEMLLDYLLRLRSSVLPAEYVNDENCKLCVNAYISHFHSDHVRGLMNRIMQSPYILVEDVYTSKPETDPAMRPATGNYDKWLEISGAYAEKHGTHIRELEWGEHVHIAIGDCGATMDLYAAITDWSIKYENADGTHDYTRGYWLMSKIRGVEFAHSFAQNLNSTWAVVNYGKNRLFFTADYSGFDNSTLAPTMDHHGRENFTHVDILMYPHHGCARYSKMLVDVSTPKYTVFTASKQEIYEQPKSLKAAAYGKKTGSIFYGSHYGAFTATCDGSSVTFDRAHDKWPRFAKLRSYIAPAKRKLSGKK